MRDIHEDAYVLCIPRGAVDGGCAEPSYDADSCQGPQSPSQRSAGATRAVQRVRLQFLISLQLLTSQQELVLRRQARHRILAMDADGEGLQTYSGPQPRTAMGGGVATMLASHKGRCHHEGLSVQACGPLESRKQPYKRFDGVPLGQLLVYS